VSQGERPGAAIAWRRRGLVFAPQGQRPWMRSHASNPLVLALAPDRLRVYFSCRDDRQRSHVGFVEIDPREPAEILRLAERPALAPGALGHFDDHGTYAMSLVERDGRLLLYYVGWNPGPAPLYYPSIGLAVSEDGGETFERYSKAPIMARSEIDPWMVSSPFVLEERGRWRMWYLSGLGWKEEEGQLRSYYHLKQASSDDGVAWRREGHVAIELAPGERNIARMCVLRRQGGYEGWYSYTAGGGYRIGYARSQDGDAWVRDDAAAGIAPEPGEFDGEAQAYPYVHEHAGRRLLFYSGDGVGRTGFGMAQEAGP
jgi:hypothetical protein